MRLDKYLKVSRIIKRRTVANNACDSEHVRVNGRDAKASYDVKIGDIIEISGKVEKRFDKFQNVIFFWYPGRESNSQVFWL